MTPDAIADAYAGLARLYDEQIALLRVEEPDLDAVGALAAEVDRRIAALPRPERLPAMSPDDARRLADAARAADARRAEAAALVAHLRAALTREAAAGERAASGVRAYAGARPGDAPRFLDERR